MNKFPSLTIGLLLALFCVLRAEVWERMAADTSGHDLGAYCKMAIDQLNRAHIVYYDDVFQDLRYALFDGEHWTIDVVDSVGNTGEYGAVAVDRYNQPHIAFWQEYLEYYNALRYATSSDTGWAKTFVATSKDTTFEIYSAYVGIDLDQQNRPGISYVRDYPSAVYYAFYDGTDWRHQRVDSVYTCHFTKLRFNSQNEPVIAFVEAYYDEKDEYVNRFKLALYDAPSKSFHILILPDTVGRTDFGSLCDFDLDSKDRYYFIYTDNNDVLKLAMYDGQSWQIEPITSEWLNGRISLKIDHQDNPAVTFMPGALALIYGIRLDGQWQFKQVDTDEYIKPIETSLGFDQENLPRIAVYGAGGTRYGGLFFYRYWPGDPDAYLPQADHDFGLVWTQSYAEWELPIINNGDAPLEIKATEFYESSWSDTTFRIVRTSLPFYIMPGDQRIITVRFNPDQAQTYSDTLYIYCNDPQDSILKIPITGTGSVTGTAANFSLRVFDVFVDHEHQQLKGDHPLSDVQVSLWQDQQLKYKPEITNSQGQAIFQGIEPGNYALKLKYEPQLIPLDHSDPRQDSLILNFNLEIGPGENSKSVFFPESLFVQKYNQIFQLTHLKGEAWGYWGDFTYRNAEAKVDQILSSWKYQLPENLSQPLGRLITTEKMVYDLFDPAHQMGNAVVGDIGELINLVFWGDQFLPGIVEMFLDFIKDILSGDPLGALANLALDLVKEFLEMQMMDLIGEGIQQAAALLPYPGEDIVMAAWHDVAAHYSGWKSFLGGFSQDSWQHMKGLIYNQLKNALFQGVYIDLMTSPVIKEAAENTQNFQYSGQFQEAYNYSQSFVAGKRDDIENTVSINNDLVTATNSFKIMSSIAQIVGAIPVPIPGLGILDAIETAMKISAYVTILSAIGMSAYEFFYIPEDMSNTMNHIYFPDQSRMVPAPKSPPLLAKRASPAHIARLKTNLLQAVSNYDSTIQSIKTKIENGQDVEALVAMKDLIEAENKLKNQLKTTLSPVYAVASLARDSVPTFLEHYNQMMEEYAKAGEARILTYFNILALPTDSSQALRDTVLAHLTQSTNQQVQLAQSVITTLDDASQLPLPAVVTISEWQQDKYALEVDETASIRFKVQNTGAEMANDVTVKLITNNRLQTEGADSIFVGNLGPGASSSWMEWQLSATSDTTYSKGIWQMDVQALGAKTYSVSGGFVIKTESTPSTGGKLDSKNIYNYPNPFNPDVEPTTLRYSLAKSADVTIRIFDSGGQLVKTLLNKQRQEAKTEQSVVWDGRNEAGDVCANGVYMVVIETSAGERAVGKIAILR